MELLTKHGIAYTHLFSIADHHRDNNTDGMWHDENGNPWISEEAWNRTKAEYCKMYNINMCTDDTARYARHFETPFSYMTIQKHKKSPNRYLEYVIDMFEKRTKDNTKKKNKPKNLEQWLNQKLAPWLSPKSKLGKEHR